MMNTVSARISRPVTVEARKQRWLDFLSPDAAPGYMFYVQYQDPDATLPPAPPHWPDRQRERVDYLWAVYEQARERSSWLDDDALPYLNMMTGTEIFAEAFGCPVVRPDDTNPFALPLIRDADAVARVKVPELSTSSLAYLFEMADELKRRGGPDALLHLIDVQSPMDIAALIWEKSAFFMGMIEAPEAVHELADKVYQLLTAFFDEWFCRYGTDFIAHCPDYFMRGGITLSEDEVGAVNAQTFATFFLPELVRLSKRYGGLGMHCCADAQHQWAGFKEIPGLRLLNLCNPPHRPSTYTQEGYRYFADHCAQWHWGWTPPGPAETWPEQMPAPCRMVITVPAKTRDEAMALCDRLQAARQ